MRAHLLCNVETRADLDVLIDDIGQLQEERSNQSEAAERQPIFLDPSPKSHRGRLRQQRLAAASENIRMKCGSRNLFRNITAASIHNTTLNANASILPATDNNNPVIPQKRVHLPSPSRPSGLTNEVQTGAYIAAQDSICASGTVMPRKRQVRACGICRQTGHTRTRCHLAQAVTAAHSGT